MTLIQRCLAGDQHAWEQIVRQHWRKVFNVAYKFVGKHDEAEDLTQDIFLKIFKSLEHVRPARQLPDLADQRQPQPVHRPLPQRPQGARDDRSRRRSGRADAGVARTVSPIAALEQRDRVELLRRRWPRCPSAADGGAAAGHPGAVVSGNRRPAAAAGRHGQVAHQPRAHRAGAADQASARINTTSSPATPPARRTRARRSDQDESDNRTLQAASPSSASAKRG